MSVAGLAAVIVAALFVLGAGPARALLGARPRAWMGAAPVIGLAMIVVAAEVPVWFFSARTWAFPVAAVLLGVSGAAWRWGTRGRQTKGVNASAAILYTVLAAAAIVVAAAPYYGVDALTTLGEHNHDFMFYLGLESELAERGYGDAELASSLPVDRIGALLRRGGWRAGVCAVSALFGALFRLAPHEVDGALWIALYATTPGTMLVAFQLLAPRASLRARGFLLVWVLLSGPQWMLLRWSFASHLAAIPLMVLFAAVVARASRERAWRRRALAALLACGTASIFPDGFPFVLALAVATTVAAPRWEEIRRRALHWRWGLLAAALMPCTIWRVVLSLRSLLHTGVPETLRTLPRGLSLLLPELVGQHMFDTVLSAWADPVAVLVRAATATTLGATAVGLVRIHPASRGALATPLVAGLVVAIGLRWAGDAFDYATWKLAVTASPYAGLAIAAALDRLAVRWAAPVGLLLLLSQSLTLARAVERAPASVGVLPEHLEIARRVAREQGEVYLVGHHTSAWALTHEHGLAYALGRHGRQLRFVPHPHSYFQTTWTEPELASPAEDAHAIVVDPATTLTAGPTFDAPDLARPLRAVRVPPGSLVANFRFLGGAFDPEHDDVRAFRWMEREARLHVDLRRGDCLEGELRRFDEALGGGLAVERRAVWPHTLFPLEQRVGDAAVVEVSADWQWHRLYCAEEDGPVVLSLTHLGGHATSRSDDRDLHVAFGRARIASAREMEGRPESRSPAP